MTSAAPKESSDRSIINKRVLEPTLSPLIADSCFLRVGVDPEEKHELATKGEISYASIEAGNLG